MAGAEEGDRELNMSGDDGVALSVHLMMAKKERDAKKMGRGEEQEQSVRKLVKHKL